MQASRACGRDDCKTAACGPRRQSIYSFPDSSTETISAQLIIPLPSERLASVRLRCARY
jgi:hypothetical protein